MTCLLVQGKSDFGHEGTPQTDSLRDSSVNYALIAIAQEITELLRQTYPIQTDELKQEKQNDTANAVLFLSSDLASFVTGETLMLDGGYVAQ